MKTEFKVNDIVVWLDPARETSSIYRIDTINDEMVSMTNRFSEVEAYIKEIRKLKDTWVCEDCGDFHPQVNAWVDANTLAYVGEGPVDHWCEKCEDNVGLIRANKYHEISKFVKPLKK